MMIFTEEDDKSTSDSRAVERPPIPANRSKTKYLTSAECRVGSAVIDAALADEASGGGANGRTAPWV